MPAQSTIKAIDVILDFLRESKPDTSFHPSLFTLTGYRSGTPHAIRYLKKAKVIEIASYNIDNQPLYKRGPEYDDRLTWLNFA